MQYFINSASTSYSFKPGLHCFMRFICALEDIFAACLICDISFFDFILLISNSMLDRLILVDREEAVFEYLDPDCLNVKVLMKSLALDSSLNSKYIFLKSSNWNDFSSSK